MIRRLVAALVAAGCSHGSAPSDAPVAPLAAASSDEVVATVDERPIYAAAVAAQARARGVDKRTALADLVDAEVLAGEAARRGLDRDLDVRLETKGALGRRLVAATFEREVTPADVPDAIVRREYQRRLPYLNHGIYADVWHLVVSVGKGASPDDKAQARARAEALAKRARGLSLDEFKKLASDEKLINEEVVTARDGWVERPFSEAAFAQLKKPGDTTTDVVETSYGYHVEYLIRWIPPEHVTLAEAAPKIRQGVFPEWRKQAFARFVADAVGRHQVELHPEHLR
jgi:PPIC-type peptidyl-prolyl cis-trans isomerase-like protein